MLLHHPQVNKQRGPLPVNIMKTSTRGQGIHPSTHPYSQPSGMQVHGPLTARQPRGLGPGHEGHRLTVLCGRTPASALLDLLRQTGEHSLG